MADNHSKQTRSYNMSRIRSKNTSPEMIIRKRLFSKGFRYRLHSKDILGKPDIVLRKYNTVIFIHGCFWHAHSGCKYSVLPKSNIDYWKPKISGNATRDSIIVNELRGKGWDVMVIWECQLKPKYLNSTFENLLALLIRNMPINTNYL